MCSFSRTSAHAWLPLCTCKKQLLLELPQLFYVCAYSWNLLHMCRYAEGICQDPKDGQRPSACLHMRHNNKIERGLKLLFKDERTFHKIRIWNTFSERGLNSCWNVREDHLLKECVNIHFHYPLRWKSNSCLTILYANDCVFKMNRN